ncbi:TonB-dependent receptor [Dissulfurirhabdus thermomarina]|uniref:TonB-dependent receptor n=1 Tax=Dissulfurirhabdus thermomarina TaxID=1765737 RepID=A0A6N9TKY9_DISTH|nr:TonB-dependent receptor [Dissulfurirhabdus thermomarina]NDY41931.1 TonB-dependent receptor [Dissulfurirhabdus thermomarina]NMX23117.1 TonB-dependent receptor [Dissulfurirhabdus thermomarina]
MALATRWTWRLLLMVGLAVVWCAPTVGAEESGLEDLLMFYRPEDLIITATRTLKRVEDAPAMATVVTADEIQRMGARTLADVVERVPGFGVSITNIGNRVFEVRGIKSYHGEKILLMVDGHRVNDGWHGGAAWTFNRMPVDNVERIEFIRGPGSALYGENAFAGVINVITKHFVPLGDVAPAKHLMEPQRFVTAYGGTEDTGGGSCYAGDADRNWAVTAYAHHFHTNGQDQTVPADILSLNPAVAGYSLAPGHTDDRLDQQDADLWLQYKELTWRTRYLQKHQGPYIGITDVLEPDSRRLSKSLFTELSWENIPLLGPHYIVKAYLDHQEMDNLWVGGPPGYLGLPQFGNGVRAEVKGKFETFGLEGQVDFHPFQGHTLSVGATYRRQHQFDIEQYANYDPRNSIITPLPGGFQDVSSFSNWASRSDHWDYDWAIFLQEEWQIMKALDLVAGVRHDHYKNFGSTTNPRVGMVWKLMENWQVKALYGEAFRAPSFIEQFNTNNPVFIGNPNLDPEKVRTTELGVIGPLWGAHVEATLFYSRYKDLIIQGPKPSLTTAAQYVNKGAAEVQGFELSAAKRVMLGVTVSGNYAYQYTRDEERGGRIPYVPAHRGNIMLDWKVLDNVFVNGRLYFCGKRYREKGDPRDELPGFATVDLSLLFRNVGIKRLDFWVKASNLLDQDYKDPAPVATISRDYPRNGRAILATVEYTF